jgi:hypothetical protein
MKEQRNRNHSSFGTHATKHFLFCHLIVTLNFKILSSAAMRLNDPKMKKLGAPFMEYDDLSLRSHSSFKKGGDMLSVSLTTKRGADALNCSTSLEEFELNLQASTESLDSPLPLLQNTSSLKRLQIRIPPGTKNTRLFSSKIICPQLRELTIWVENERPKRLQLAFMRNAAEHRRRRARSHDPMRYRTNRPTNLHLSYAETAKQFNLKDIAKFIALQPNLNSLKIQTSTLTMEQWAALTVGINANRSLKHLEFRRVEAAGHNSSFPFEDLAHHPTIQSVDLNGCPTMFDWHQLAKRNSKLQRLSWSSSPMKLECLRQLSELLSLHTSSLIQLEISHTNLSGQKAILIAQMLKGNTSLRDLNLTNSQLNGRDGFVLTKGLKYNSTLQRLSLNDNSMLKSPCDLTFQGFKELLSTPNTNIRYLDLRNNEMDAAENDIRCAQIFDGLRKNTKLKVLKLSNKGTRFFESFHNAIWEASGHHHPQVCRSLGNAMKHCVLTELDMNHNDLGNITIAKYLAPGLAANRQLENLSLKRVGMGDEAMIAISKALTCNCTLKYMDISHNCDITHLGFEQFAPCLATMSELQTLWFHSSSDESYASILAPALKTQYSLREMSHEQYLTIEEHVLLIANRNGRKSLYQEGDLSDSLWPIVLGRISHMPRVLALFLGEKTDLLTCALARPSPIILNKKRKLV